MKKIGVLAILLFTAFNFSHAQSDGQIFRVPREVLAGEGLDFIKQKDSTRTVYQKKVFQGKELAIFIVAIGSGITNEFESFPMEEFIFWKNGKAIVEPEGENAFPIHSGDYFIQAKGFNGKWNFIGDGQLHLELALIAVDRPESDPSPISKALVLERDLISGVTSNEEAESQSLYKGVELTVKINRSGSRSIQNLKSETMMHVVNGILSVTSQSGEIEKFYPGDFFVLLKGFSGEIESIGTQSVRVLEVTRS